MSPCWDVPVDQNDLLCGSDITRLPLKKSWVLSDQRNELVGLACQSGWREGRWMTVRASWVWLTRRKPREKVLVESFKRD